VTDCEWNWKYNCHNWKNLP